LPDQQGLNRANRSKKLSTVPGPGDWFLLEAECGARREIQREPLVGDRGGRHGFHQVFPGIGVGPWIWDQVFFGQWLDGEKVQAQKLSTGLRFNGAVSTVYFRGMIQAGLPRSWGATAFTAQPGGNSEY